MRWNSLKTKTARWFCRPVNALSLLGASLLALDHRWTNLTWGGLSLLAGVVLIKLPATRRKPAPPAPVRVTCRVIPPR